MNGRLPRVQGRLAKERFRCLACGRVFEAQGILPEDFKKVIAQTRNFEVASRSIGIFGYCETCRSKEKVPRRKEV